jgi:hypothetical protein
MKPITRTGKNVAKTVEAGTPPRLRLPLSNVADCRREIARVYRQARARTLDTAEASKLVNILFILARLVESSVIEERLSKLEAEHEIVH